MEKKTVKEVVEEVCGVVCDELCKYRDTVQQDGKCNYQRENGDCPLDRLV